MTAPADILAYRDADHTVAETMERFNIGESAVYKACRVARKAARQPAPDAPQQPVAAPTPPTPPTLPIAPPPPQNRAETFHASLGDVAGDDCDWTCPYTGATYPVIPMPVPGTTRAMWHAERRAHLHRPAPPKVDLRQVQAAPPAPGPLETEALPQSPPVPAPRVVQPPRVVHLHRSTPMPDVRPLAMQGYIIPGGINWKWWGGVLAMVAFILIFM